MTNAGYKALIKEQSSAVTFTDEATTTSDDQAYQITDAAKRIFDFDTAVVVEDGGVPTTEPYTLNKLTGTVTFETVDAGRVITLSGKYVTLTTLAEGYEFSFDGVLDMGDVTVFQDEARNYKPLLSSATATIGKFYTIDNYYIDMLFNKEVKVIEFYAEDTIDPFRFFAYVSGDSLSLPVEGLIEETINLQVTEGVVV